MNPKKSIERPDDPIRMVDLQGQYLRVKEEMDLAIQEVLDSGTFINGPSVRTFADELAQYLPAAYVIPCGNGTEALQIALMALRLTPGDEVIIPAFAYAAAAEAVALLGLTPVWADVSPDSFNLDVPRLEEACSSRTRAIIAVHLFGQSCDMAPLLQLAERYNACVIEDNAQSLGSVYTFPDGRSQAAGTIGHIGITSFFPSKPLACYGDGGALFTNDPELALRMTQIANHGQDRKYNHLCIGMNSRLDTIQAAILRVKLRYLNEYTKARREVAAAYTATLHAPDYWQLPVQELYSTHVWHQYTLRIKEGRRDELQRYLQTQGIPSMVYYPLPLHRQPAYKDLCPRKLSLPIAEQLCGEVLSLPVHTELNEQQPYILKTLLVWTEQFDLL